MPTFSRSLTPNEWVSMALTQNASMGAAPLPPAPQGGDWLDHLMGTPDATLRPREPGPGIVVDPLAPERYRGNPTLSLMDERPPAQGNGPAAVYSMSDESRALAPTRNGRYGDHLGPIPWTTGRSWAPGDIDENDEARPNARLLPWGDIQPTEAESRGPIGLYDWLSTRGPVTNRNLRRQGETARANRAFGRLAYERE